MRPEPKKRIDTNAAGTPRAGLNPAFAGLQVSDVPASPQASGAPSGAKVEAPAESKAIWKMGRVVLRRETARRGGKTVIVIHDFATHLPLSVIEAVAKKIRSSCGCGGAVKERTIEIQGNQPAKLRAVLEAEGFEVAGVH